LPTLTINFIHDKLVMTAQDMTRQTINYVLPVYCSILG